MKCAPALHVILTQTIYYWWRGLIWWYKSCIYSSSLNLGLIGNFSNSVLSGYWFYSVQQRTMCTLRFSLSKCHSSHLSHFGKKIRTVCHNCHCLWTRTEYHLWFLYLVLIRCQPQVKTSSEWLIFIKLRWSGSLRQIESYGQEHLFYVVSIPCMRLKFNEKIIRIKRISVVPVVHFCVWIPLVVVDSPVHSWPTYGTVLVRRGEASMGYLDISIAVGGIAILIFLLDRWSRPSRLRRTLNNNIHEWKGKQKTATESLYLKCKCWF